MNYFLYKGLSLLVMPLGVAFVALVAAIVLLWVKRRRSAWIILIALAGWLWLWCTPWWSDVLRGSLEKHYPWKPAEQYPVAGAIVSLGGGVRGTAGRLLPPVDLGAAADREVFAAQLYHAGKAPKIIVSGGVDPITAGGATAVAQKKFLVMLGVPANAVTLEVNSRNTAENARETIRLLQASGIRSILLVTSAMHMPRALRLFSTAGLQVIPAPADFEVTPRPFTLHSLLPDAGALESSTRAAREIVGRWVAKMGLQ